MMSFKITILLVCHVLLAGCSSSINQPTRDDMAARLVTLERERHWSENNEERLVMELEAAKRRNVELEQRVDDLSRNSLTKAKADLTKAQRS
jgi:outer membrane murein-binding lipoprotein Lpp